MDTLRAKNRRNKLIIGWGMIVVGLLGAFACAFLAAQDHIGLKSWRTIRPGTCALALVIGGASYLNSNEES